MCSLCKILALLLVMAAAPQVWAGSDHAKPQPGNNPAANPDADRIFYQEAKLVETMHKFTPMVETYIQELKPDKELGNLPSGDKYFLGRLVLDEKGINNKVFDKRGPRSLLGRVLDRLNNFYKMNYASTGFMQLVFLNYAFDKDHYDLKFLREQFLGEVRTKVYDVIPRPRFKGPHFVGRIWVEDQDYTIVRMNGTYEPQSRGNYYFHFDSWRMNLQPGLWLPVYIYTEESDANYAAFRHLAMKGQTRLWGYDLKHSGVQSEYTNMRVESEDKQVADKSANGDNEYVPVQSQHLWEREAEDNLLDRMERAGIMAPDGEVSKVLQTVVNNMEITNKLNIEPEVRCRVLLTTPLESFTIGHTIVVSRGLLDVLPDEASLAMVLAHDLGHIVLGHSLDTRYAFSDRMIFQDEEVFRRIAVHMNEHDEDAADQKGMELLKNSPYKDKLASAGLFLVDLEKESHHLSWLINPRFGNKLTHASKARMGELAQSAPQLEVNNLAQIPALPLGSRVKLSPWDDHVEMKKSKPVALLSPRDKMSFQVTPVIPNLVRYNGGNELAKQGDK